MGALVAQHYLIEELSSLLQHFGMCWIHYLHVNFCIKLYYWIIIQTSSHSKLFWNLFSFFRWLCEIDSSTISERIQQSYLCGQHFYHGTRKHNCLVCLLKFIDHLFGYMFVSVSRWYWCSYAILIICLHRCLLVYLVLYYSNSLDNSDYMRNGDYIPTRLQAQQDAVSMVCHSKIRQHPENSVGLVTLGGWVVPSYFNYYYPLDLINI